MSLLGGYPVLRPQGEGLGSMWLRRLASIPLYFTLAAIGWGGAPLWLGLGAAADLVRGAGLRLPRARCIAFFLLFLGCEVWGVVGAGLVWLVTLGGRIGGHARYRATNAALQRSWTGALFWGAVWIFRMRLRLEGMEHALPAPYLLLVRHASSADTVLAAALLANPHRVLLKYVLKRELLWDPSLDIVGRRLPNVFVDRSGRDRDAEVAAVARLADSLGERQAVLIYPEGTRFTPAKRDRAVAALRESGRAELAAMAERFAHVLPPRLGGPLSLMEHAPGVDVLLLEHVGFDRAVSFAAFLRGAFVRQTITARLRRFPARDLPPDADGRARWLYERWAELDAWVGTVRAEDEARGRAA